MTNGISCSATKISPRLCSADCGTSARPFASTDLPCVSLKANYFSFPELSRDLIKPESTSHLPPRCRGSRIAVMNLVSSYDPRKGHSKRAQMGHSCRAARLSLVTRDIRELRMGCDTQARQRNCQQCESSPAEHKSSSKKL